MLWALVTRLSDVLAVIGRDPEANRLSSGNPVVRLSVATSETYPAF